MTSNDCLPIGTKRPQPVERAEVFIALPTYSTWVGQFAMSLINALPRMKAAICPAIGDSLVTRARNNIAHEFMKTDIPWLLFIDTDLEFPPEHIEHLISHDSRFPIVGGCYPKKKLGSPEWVLNAMPGSSPDANGLQEVAEMGTGLLKIHRSVFAAVREAYPQLRYRCDAHKDIRYDFFPVGTYRDATFKPEDPARYLSEDWYICQLARAIGYRVFADTRCTAKHHGSIAYPVTFEDQKPATPAQTIGGKLGTSPEKLAAVLNDVEKTKVEDTAAIAPIVEKTKGWSGLAHYQFFRSLLASAAPAKMLVAGVYRGRDLSFILDAARRFHPVRPLALKGVDAFSDKPCADWPEEKRSMTWEQAGFGPPPSFSAAVAACSEFATHDHFNSLVITEQNDEKFLAETTEKFDVIYLDTSHDYETVARQLRQVARVCSSANTIICGDDYSDAGTWGVKRAVSEAFTSHGVFAGAIWFSDLASLKIAEAKVA